MYNVVCVSIFYEYDVVWALLGRKWKITHYHREVVAATLGSYVHMCVIERIFRILLIGLVQNHNHYHREPPLTTTVQVVVGGV